MSIFVRKKGDYDATPSPAASRIDPEVADRAPSTVVGHHHQVYYVRGRPFIAPASAIVRRAPNEEFAALFRNNLLRSCWKPGLAPDEVQAVLTLWESRLVEIMHRWLHPELWHGFGRWRQRMWRWPWISAVARKVWFRRAAPVLRQWRSRSRIRALGPFLLARVLIGWVRTWRFEAAFRCKVNAVYIYFPFRKWVACHKRARTHSSQRLVSDRQRQHLALMRWSRMDLVRSWSRWAVKYVPEIKQLRVSVACWVHGALAQALRLWLARAAERAEALALLYRTATRLRLRDAARGWTTWQAKYGSARRAKLDRMRSVLETLRAPKRRDTFNVWAEWASRHARIGRLTISMAQLLVGVGARKAFHSWRSAGSAEWAAEAALNAALTAWTQATKRRGLNTWMVRAVASFERARRAAAAFVSHDPQGSPMAQPVGNPACEESSLWGIQPVGNPACGESSL